MWSFKILLFQQNEILERSSSSDFLSADLALSLDRDYDRDYVARLAGRSILSFSGMGYPTVGGKETLYQPSD